MTYSQKACRRAEATVAPSGLNVRPGRMRQRHPMQPRAHGAQIPPATGLAPAADDTAEDMTVTRTASAARQVRRCLRTLTRHLGRLASPT